MYPKQDSLTKVDLGLGLDDLSGFGGTSSSRWRDDVRVVSSSHTSVSEGAQGQAGDRSMTLEKNRRDRLIFFNLF